MLIGSCIWQRLCLFGIKADVTLLKGDSQFLRTYCSRRGSGVKFDIYRGSTDEMVVGNALGVISCLLDSLLACAAG